MITPTIRRGDLDHTPSDNGSIVKEMNPPPSAPLSKTTTTLVGQVRGDPAPHPNTDAPKKIKSSQGKPMMVDSGHDSPPSTPSPPINQSRKLRSSSSSASSDLRSASMLSSRPKSQVVTGLPPKAPSRSRPTSAYMPNFEVPDHTKGGQRQRYNGDVNQTDGQRPRHDGDVTYADLDHRAFMVPANQVLPPPPHKQTYAEISVSRSKIV